MLHSNLMHIYVINNNTNFINDILDSVDINTFLIFIASCFIVISLLMVFELIYKLFNKNRSNTSNIQLNEHRYHNRSNPTNMELRQFEV